MPVAGRKSWQPTFEALHQLALTGMNIGVGGDVDDTGETVVIDALKGLPGGKIVFDVGGNVGDYTAAVLARLRDGGCEVYCFEPLALSDRESEVTLWGVEGLTGLASVHHRDLKHVGLEMAEQETIETTTIDRFCAEHGIGRIDLLKIDVEGHEMAVLRGAASMLEARRIGLIQFEFGGASMDSRIFLRDLFRLLEPTHSIARILRDGWVDIGPYAEKSEVFITTNFLATPRPEAPAGPQSDDGPVV
jgi:hypothetical protein